MIEAIGWDKIKDYFENQIGIKFIWGPSKKRLSRSVGEGVVSSSAFQGLPEGWEVVERWSGRLRIEVGPKCQALPCISRYRLR